MRASSLLVVLLGAACLPPLPAYKGDEGSDDGGGSAGTTDTPDADPDSDGDGYAASIDCDDTDSSVHPGAEEVCGGGDENCDGTVDEPDAVDCVSYFPDRDGDGYGAADEPVCLCAPDDPWDADDNSDCDDDDRSIHPGAEIICRTGVAEGCDLRAEQLACRWTGQAMNEAAMAADGAEFIETYPGGGLGRALATIDTGGGTGLAAVGRPTGHGASDLPFGKVNVYQTPITGSFTVDTGAPRGGDAVLVGVDTEAGFGQAVALHSDLDGAGWTDVLVHSTGDGITGGYVSTFYGPLSSGVEHKPDAVIELALSAVTFGQATLTDPGDINGDGIADLIITNTHALSVGATGAAWFVYGPVTGDLQLVDRDDGVFAVYDRFNTGLGARVSSTLDAAGDAIVVLAEPGYDAQSGAAHLFLAADLRGEVVDLDDARSYSGVSNGSCGMGAEVADLTGDGHPELVVGCPGADGGLGEVYIFEWNHIEEFADVPEMDRASWLARITGSADLRSIGLNTVAAGNIDLTAGDELAIVGGRGDESTGTEFYLSYIQVGSELSGELTLPGADWSHELRAPVVGSGAGIIMSDAAWLNGDPLPDLLVGVMRTETASESRGGALLVPGMGP